MSAPIIRRRGDRRGGLPSTLPDGERILWQGGPDARGLARRVLHVRKVAFYLALMLCWFAVGDYSPAHAGRTLAGFLCLALLGLLALGALMLFALLLSRSTIYTLTNHRIVIRFGIALTMSINLPLQLVSSAALRLSPDGSGDIPLSMIGRQKLGYGVLWPHVRPWRLSRPEPMLRAIPDAARVAQLLADALAASALAAGNMVPFPARGEPQPVPEPVTIREPEQVMA